MNDDNTCPKCWEQFASRIGLTEHKCAAKQIVQVTSQQFVATALGLNFIPPETGCDEKKTGGDA